MPILKSLRTSVPLLIVVALLFYTWTNIIVGNSMARWQHYTGLAGFLVIIIALLFSYRNTTTIAIGVYLILGIFSLLAITPSVTTVGVRIGALATPGIQVVPLALFIIYAFLNFNALCDMYLDYKEKQVASKSSSPMEDDREST